MRLLLSSLLLLSFPSFAQTFEQTALLRLAGSPMSVRGAAMGGVSIDDPKLNPASIASLKQPTFSIAGARSTFSVTRFDVSGPILSVRRDDVEATSLSHVYAAVPIRDFVVGAWYRTEPRIGSATPFATPGAAEFDDSICAVSCGMFLMVDGSPAFERRETSYGMSGAWSRGPLAVGVGAEIVEVDERYQLFRMVLEGSPTVPSFSRQDALIRSASGRDFVPNAGIRWQASPKIALAAAYNGGGSFDRKTEVCTTANDGTTNCATRLVSLGDSRLKTVDSWRASVTYALTESLQVVGEAVRRNYSSLSAEPYSLGSQSLISPYRDATELHAGAEYRLRRVALRAGWWRDPAHYANGLSFYFIDPLAGDADHVTFGAGVDLGARARLDVAFDDANDPALRRATAGITVAAF